MTFLKIDQVVINPEKIAYISPMHAMSINPTEQVPVVLGLTIHFDGGAKVDIYQPEAMNFFLAWAGENGHEVQVV